MSSSSSNATTKIPLEYCYQMFTKAWPIAYANYGLIIGISCTFAAASMLSSYGFLARVVSILFLLALTPGAVLILKDLVDEKATSYSKLFTFFEDQTIRNRCLNYLLLSFMLQTIPALWQSAGLPENHFTTLMSWLITFGSIGGTILISFSLPQLLFTERSLKDSMKLNLSAWQENAVVLVAGSVIAMLLLIVSAMLLLLPLVFVAIPVVFVGFMLVYLAIFDGLDLDALPKKKIKTESKDAPSPI